MAANLPAARAAAEEFRAKHLTGKLFDKIPLDVLYVAEIVLRLDVIPFHRLYELTGASAALIPSLGTIYVDQKLYDSQDSKWNPSNKNRLRFSIGHELGHIHMHSHLVEKIRCQKVEDLPALLNNGDQERHDLEKQANEFAGRLIVPLIRLKDIMANFGKHQKELNWRDSGELRIAFADRCSKHFGLHPDSIKTRLDREEVWPSEWIVGGR